MCRSPTLTVFYYLFFITTPNVFGSTPTDLTKLIEKIYIESDSVTVLFFGIENNVVSYFIEQKPDIPVAFFNSHSQIMKNHDHRYFTNAILVITYPFPNYEMLDYSIRKLHFRKFVIFKANNLKDLMESFSYFFQKKKFTRLFGIVEGVAYAYLPYADIKLEELNFTKPSIPNALRNLNGYKFRTVAKADLPRVFWFTNKRGQNQIGGYVGKLFKAFLQKYNASFTRAEIKNLDKQFMMTVINATIRNEVDVSVNVYQNFEGIKLSYPLKMMSWFIVAPIIGHLDPNHYFLRPFSSNVWLTIGLCSLYMIVMHMLKNKLCNQPVKIWECFSQNYLTLLMWPTEKPVTCAYRFQGLVILFAFVLVNLYLVYLTSFLTVYIKVAQHKTIQDLVKHKVPVMLVDYEWKLVSREAQDLAKIVILVEHDVLIQERNSMKNLSLAYALGRDKAEFFIGLQKYPKYHIIFESLKDYYLGFVLAKHSHFHEILNDFIMQISDTGLMEKWMRDSMVLIKKYELLVVNTTSDHLKPPYPLSMFHLNFAWVCLLSGLALAVVVFILEMLLFRCRKKF